MIKKLKIEYLKENVINRINNIIIIDIENELNDIINDIIFEFENDEIDINEIDVINEFDIKNELTLYLKNELFKNNEIYYEFYDDIIELINLYDPYKNIYENDIDEIELMYDMKLNINQFHNYKNSDDLILHNLSYDYCNTIDYYELNEIFNENDIDEIIDVVIDELI